MTFEEFLIKKKIDPVQLQAKEQSFFSEFESHFLQMGEKSFDHSKKFWFNKLRRTYHLKEEIKIVETPVIVQEKLSSEPLNQEKPIYKSRFNAAKTQQTESITQETESNSPPKYIPRFKAAVDAPEQNLAAEIDKSVELEEKVIPVYKPKFKSKIAEIEEKQSEIQGESAPDLNSNPKSAYKPRFKPGITKKGAESE
jgi:hypothetical protein